MKTSPNVTKNIKIAASMGIEMVTEFIEGTPISIRKVKCMVCGAVEAHRHSPAAPPEQLRQRFERAGWRIGTKGCLCSQCSKSRKPTITQVVAGQIRDVEYQEEQVMPKKSNVVQMQSATEEPLRQPAPADKAAIRQFLDGHFDDARGNYLDGYTDEKAGETLNVPWAWVRDLREFAYGPIKSDLEAEERRVEIASLRKSVEDMMEWGKKYNASVDASNKVASDIKRKVVDYNDIVMRMAATMAEFNKSRVSILERLEKLEG